MAHDRDPLALYGALVVMAVGWFLGAGIVIHNWGFAAAGAAACVPALLIAMRARSYPRTVALVAGLMLITSIAFGTAQITIDLQAWAPNSPVTEYSCGSTLHYATTRLAGRQFALEDPAFAIYPTGEVAQLQSMCGLRLAASDRLFALFSAGALVCYAAGLLPWTLRRLRTNSPHMSARPSSGTDGTTFHNS
jgi:hypothetical protein